MSPAFGRQRRYVVGFMSWDMYEVVVLATSEEEARAKGRALYEANGLAEFTFGASGAEAWRARCLDVEARS